MGFKMESKPMSKLETYALKFEGQSCEIEIEGTTRGRIYVCVAEQGRGRCEIVLDRTQAEELLKFLDAWYWEINEH